MPLLPILKKTLRYLLPPMAVLAILISSPVRNRMITGLEVKPISTETINELKQHRTSFQHYAYLYSIPEVVLVASVGSEVNRRIYTNWVIDFVQDRYFGSSLCSEKILTRSINSQVNSRYLNLSRQDIGLGNIRVLTAWQMVERYPQHLPLIKTKKNLVEYLLTPDGNIHIAALILREADHLFRPYCSSLDSAIYNAILYSYYKQGESFYDRYASNSEFKRPPEPGEGRELLDAVDQAW